MGKLKVIKPGPLSTIQDFGRFGFRQYGIPQSGAMDRFSMIAANQSVGNPNHFPVIEYALTGMKLEALEDTLIGVQGGVINVNGKKEPLNSIMLRTGDMVDLSPPTDVYAYMAIEGQLKVNSVFGSYSTYLMGKFGGYKGRTLKTDDMLITIGIETASKKSEKLSADRSTDIRYIAGPESTFLNDSLHRIKFRIGPSSNRMGIRLSGAVLKARVKEIASSAVIPGVIQLPPDGLPIVLMNDCQTTGGYPRIGKVIDEDLGKLAQCKPGSFVEFQAHELTVEGLS